MCTCYVRASTTTRARLYIDQYARHVRDQNENATYASTRWDLTVRHFLACEDVAGGSQQLGGRIVFFSDALPCMRRCSSWVPAVRGRIIFFRTHFLACEDVAGGSHQTGGNVFFAKYYGPSGGSPLSGGGIIILRVIRRHFLACGRGPSCRPLHVQSTSDGSCSLTTLTSPRSVACMRPWAWCVPTVSLSRTVIFR